MISNLISKTSWSRLKKITLIVLVFLSFQSCFHYGYVDEDLFLGTWQLEGRDLYKGMTIQITKEDNELKGYVLTKPNNKYGQTLIKCNEIWITKIERGANYYFKITEQKIASELFALYGMETSSRFYATFSESKDTIFLLDKNPNRFIEESKIYYKKIKQ